MTTVSQNSKKTSVSFPRKRVDLSPNTIFNAWNTNSDPTVQRMWLSYGEFRWLL